MKEERDEVDQLRVFLEHLLGQSFTEEEMDLIWNEAHLDHDEYTLTLTLTLISG